MKNLIQNCFKFLFNQALYRKEQQQRLAISEKIATLRELVAAVNIKRLETIRTHSRGIYAKSEISKICRRLDRIVELSKITVDSSYQCNYLNFGF